MDWPASLGSLRRGLGIASRVAVARLRETAPFTAPEPVRPGPRRPAAARPDTARPETGRFVVLREFGPNPGHLRLLAYRPKGRVQPGAPLIVLLHGCGQDAADFAVEAGWTALADQIGVPLLLPEQVTANNHQRCFHWFHLAHARRGHGEAASIAAMLAASTARWKSDPRRVFVAGLSAGGAMAAALLAAYPDVFAAGAVFAGLPVGTSTSMMQALTHMASGAPDAAPAEWVARAHRVAPPDHAGPWPRLSIWRGDADNVVAPDNAERLAEQWRALHGLPEAPTRQTRLRQGWGDAVELWTLPGLGHAWAIGAGKGRPSQFAVQAPVDAVAEIARFWGIL